MLDPNGSAASALKVLSEPQISFLKSLPKAEIHAHLNGCIPLITLQALVSQSDQIQTESDSIRELLQTLAQGVSLDKIDNFFSLFPAIYAITSSPGPLRTATAAADISQSSDATVVAIRSQPSPRNHHRSAPATDNPSFPRQVVGLSQQSAGQIP